MMNKDQEKWISSVMDSTKGIRKAEPSADLLAKIERQIDASEFAVIRMQQWRIAVAAAVLLLALNVFLIRQYMQSNDTNIELVSNDSSTETLISNYKLYE